MQYNPTSLNRRRFLSTVSAGGASILLSSRRIYGSPAGEARILESRTISPQSHLYHGWPTLTRRSNGKLVVVYSGGREAHVCPFGRVEMMTSNDDGRHWSWPRILLDSVIDDRDAGVMETPRGSLLVTTFTSLAYRSVMEQAAKIPPSDASAWSQAKWERWRAVDRRVTPSRQEEELGQWMLRSTDGGLTWSSRYACPANSPHGPIALADGRLLYAGKELWTGERRVGFCESTDDGRTWKWIATLPTRPGDKIANYHELHAVEAGSGRLISHIRNHNSTDNREILQSESEDGGYHWTEPHAIGVWGLPSFLLRLRDGRLLMTYGYRRPPFGIQARLSPDAGAHWSDPLYISRDGTSADLGYPSTVELRDGSFLTVWYERQANSSMAVLRQAHWEAVRSSLIHQ